MPEKQERFQIHSCRELCDTVYNNDVSTTETIRFRTIDLWPLLGPEVTPVLYLAPSSDRKSSDYVRNLTKLADHACRKGWDVLIAPHCNEYNYPVLPSMFRLVQQQYNSQWYGYSNADILFTNTFWKSLQFVGRQRRPNTSVDFVIGQRHNVVVCMTSQVNITFTR